MDNIDGHHMRGDELPMIKKGAALLVCAVLALHLTACGSGPEPLPPEKDVDILSPSQAAYDWPEDPEEIHSLTVAVAIAQNTPAGQALLTIKDELEQRSNGAVTLDIFWESTLGGAPEIAESIATGTVDIGLISSAVISNYTHAIDVLSLPFIIENRQQFKAVLDNCFDSVYRGDGGDHWDPHGAVGVRLPPSLHGGSGGPHRGGLRRPHHPRHGRSGLQGEL